MSHKKCQLTLTCTELVNQVFHDHVNFITIILYTCSGPADKSRGQKEVAIMT